MGSGNLRHLGMIATSNSWRRFWLEYRWKKYAMVSQTADAQGKTQE